MSEGSHLADHDSTVNTSMSADLVAPALDGKNGTHGARVRSIVRSPVVEAGGAPIIRWLYARVPDGFLELLALPSKDRSFLPLPDLSPLKSFAEAHQHENLYFGIAARGTDQDGSAANCRWLPMLFVDVDYKDAPDEATARERLAAFRLPPTLVIASGGGLHLYWLLREPIDLTTRAAAAKQILRRIAVAVGGDLKSAEVARHLRLPGTRNFKPEYGQPRLVCVESFTVEHLYDLADFDSLPAEPAVTTTAPYPFVMPPKIHAGERNDVLFKFARSMKAKGLTETEILAALQVVNASRCEPPLDDDEILKLARGASTQADQPGFAPLRQTGETAPPVLVPAAFHGLAGKIMKAIAPYSEADEASTLAHFLVAVGNMIGRGPHALVERSVHACNEYVMIVGDTAKARKGTSWSTPRYILSKIDAAWAKTRIVSGLSSGEGIIDNVRDPREEQQPVKEKGQIVGYQTVIVDHGVTDKRLLVIEEEIALVLHRMRGETNSLSPVLRQAWDGGILQTLTKNSPQRATHPHVSVIAHTTREELRTSLTSTDLANGFANRFMPFWVTRSKYLPNPSPVPDEILNPFITDLLQILSWGRKPRLIVRDAEAEALWATEYRRLSTPESGLIGALLARAEAHVLRLSVIYAVLDRSEVVKVEHLEAALAVWDFVDRSARLIFGTQRTGLSLADTILEALRKRGPMTRDDIMNMFHRNKSADDIEAVLPVLLDGGKARRSFRAPEGGKGRPAEVWEAVGD